MLIVIINVEFDLCQLLIEECNLLTRSGLKDPNLHTVSVSSTESRSSRTIYYIGILWYFMYFKTCLEEI